MVEIVGYRQFLLDLIKLYFPITKIGEILTWVKENSIPLFLVELNFFFIATSVIVANFPYEAKRYIIAKNELRSNGNEYETKD
ncbi:hypothetical protein [Virgibacillus sp. JSM 102003]|uniref:hypothetical protein n=1 Tax=Virgibacillus sp. JSM 102003 TaxID=1562108 RepID=UPI0035C081DA